VEEIMTYADIYSKSMNEAEAFWMDVSKNIDWFKKPSRALFDERPPFFEWFKDSEVNCCWNAVDRHVLEGNGERIAIIYDSPVTGTKRKISYSELQTNVAALAGGLKSKGVSVGDRVLIYMPMVPEALEAMLACSRLGAIHSVVFGGFAANELATRINDSEPKAIITGSCGIEVDRIIAYKPLLDEAINLATFKPEFCVVLQREQHRATMKSGRDFDWVDFKGFGAPTACVPVNGDHPLYILYTSGTTGEPKGVVRPTAGHLVSLHWTMKNIYNVKPGDVYWAASDVGWVVGHSYIVYAPLLNGNTTVLFEGKPVGTPDAGTFWRVIEEYQVKVLFTAPTAFRAIKRNDPTGFLAKKYNMKSLQSLFLAGERADPDTVAWAKNILQVPIVDHWWQTETGSPIVANPLGIEELPFKIGSPSVAMPGWDVQILDSNGQKVKPNELGSVVIKLPLPPGSLSTLWNAEERYLKSYLSTFPGFYETGDSGYVDEGGYLYIMARTDDVINVAGHRLSTGAIEEVLSAHPDVGECAVIGVSDDLKGQVPLGLLCLNTGSGRLHSDVVVEVIQNVRNQIGPVAAFKVACVVERLPKTRSGKILRSTMVAIADGKDYKIPATIDDPDILSEIAVELRKVGYSQ
jgi:propionyl-CoA synthetase